MMHSTNAFLPKAILHNGLVCLQVFSSTPTEIKNRLTILFMMQPCVRRQGEFEHDEIRDVDNVITTKNLGDLLRLKGINIADDLEPTTFDSPFQTNGVGSGAGQLFGATGGVMEAAVRSVYEIVMGAELPRLELDAVRGLNGTKEAVIPLHNQDNTVGLPVDLRIAVVNGLRNAKKLIKRMKAGEV